MQRTIHPPNRCRRECRVLAPAWILQRKTGDDLMSAFLTFRSDFAGTAKDIASGLSIMAVIIGSGMLLCGVFG